MGAWGHSLVPEHPALATGSAVETCAGRGRYLAGVLEQRVHGDGIAPTWNKLQINKVSDLLKDFYTETNIHLQRTKSRVRKK